MKVHYIDSDVCDCTGDPHHVSYTSAEAMMDDVEKVLNSKLVRAVASVTVDLEGDVFESDTYTDFHLKDDQKPVGHTAESDKHKIAGLYFYEDSPRERGRRLLPGRTGVFAIFKKIRNVLKKNPAISCRVSIGVTWDAFGGHNCSDYITMDFDDRQVDYSNQDWYIGESGYAEHCKKLSDLLGVEIEEGDPKG